MPQDAVAPAGPDLVAAEQDHRLLLLDRVRLDERARAIVDQELAAVDRADPVADLVAMRTQVVAGTMSGQPQGSFDGSVFGFVSCPSLIGRKHGGLRVLIKNSIVS